MAASQVVSAPLADRVSGHVLLRNISWSTYSILLEEAGDGATRLTYDHGLLEIEVPSRHHEIIKTFVGELVTASLKYLGLDFEPSGSATWRRETELRGLEADECYHIQNARRIVGKVELDLEIDPPPDLAIEVDLTSTSLNKVEIYETLGVGEIWRIGGEGKCAMVLRTGAGTYEPIDRSSSVPLLTAVAVGNYVMLRERVGRSEAMRQFEAEVLVPKP